MIEGVLSCRLLDFLWLLSVIIGAEGCCHICWRGSHTRYQAVILETVWSINICWRLLLFQLWRGRQRVLWIEHGLPETGIWFFLASLQTVIFCSYFYLFHTCERLFRLNISGTVTYLHALVMNMRFLNGLIQLVSSVSMRVRAGGMMVRGWCSCFEHADRITHLTFFELRSWLSNCKAGRICAS